MIDWALLYISFGWSVFPCHPGQKIPLTPHGVKDASTDPATVRAWWTRWPDANIGLACGAKAATVDLDKKDGVDGEASLKEFDALPDTVTSLTPTGGKHFIYRTDNPPRNKNSFRDGIDIRSEGYYIILPPSIHPCGKPYQWAPGKAPGEIPFAEFPDCMRPKRPLRPWESGYNQQEPAKTPPAKAPERPQGTPVIERARLYLQECEPAVQGQAGHDKLLWAARALVVGFELDKMTAIGLLWNEYNPRCSPPWDPAKSGDTKDFERKVEEAVKTPGEKPRGWLLDEYGLRQDNDAAAMTYGGRLQAALLASVKSEEATTPPTTPKLGRKADSTDIPKWVLDPPGLVGEMARWINNTAGCYQPLFALQAAMIACGVIFGRKVRDESGGRTNLYGIGVGHSTAGKDHPGKCIAELLLESGAEKYLGGKPTSDSAIELMLSQWPISLFMLDEMGHYLSQIKQASISSGSQHLTSIVPCLMELYTSANKPWLGKIRADEEQSRRKILQPHVGFWGLTTPDKLYSALSTKEIQDGWLGRVVTVISLDIPRYQWRECSPPPPSLITQTSAWVTREIPAKEGDGDIRGSVNPNQILVPTHPAARKRLEDFGEACYLRRVNGDDSDPTLLMWGRAMETARRIALTLAVGENYDGAEISEANADLACTWVSSNLLRFREYALPHIADTTFERERQFIQKLISDKGKIGIAKSELTRRSQRIKDKKMRDGYLAELVEAGIVNVGTKNKNTWYWVAPFGLEQKGE